MAAVMRIYCVPMGTTPQVPSFYIDCGKVPADDWTLLESHGYMRVLKENVDVTDITDIRNSSLGATNGVYDCYCDSVFSEETKLNFKMLIQSSRLIIYDDDTGSAYSIDTSFSYPIYLMFNEFSGITISLSNKEEIKAYFAKFLLRYHNNNVMAFDGMNTSRSAPLVVIKHDTNSSSGLYYCGNNQGNNSGSDCYYGLTGPYNWYKMITGEYMYEPPYVETANDEKIYMSMSFPHPIPISQLNIPNYIKDHMFLDRNNTLFPFYDEYGQPVVSANFQSGTNLVKLLPHLGDEILLKNGGKIRYINKKQEGSSWNHYCYEIVYDDTYNVSSMISTVTLDGTTYNGSIMQPTSQNPNPPFASYMVSMTLGGSAYDMVGAYLWASPNMSPTNANIKKYIKNHAGETSSFWNNFPNAPFTIGYVGKTAFIQESKNVAGATTNIDTRKSNFNNYFKIQDEGMTNSTYILRDLLMTNVVGFNNTDSRYQTQDYTKAIGVTISIPSTVSSNDYLKDCGGAMGINSAEGAYTLLGITMGNPDTEPDHGSDSVGGGEGDYMDDGNAVGGNGSYDDRTYDVEDYDGTTQPINKLMKLWYMDPLYLENSMDFIHTWLQSSSILFDDMQPRLQAIISLKQINMWSAPPMASSKSSVSILGSHPGGDPGLMLNALTSTKASLTIGTFHLYEYFGSFLDYAPYTSIKIYLPYSGTYDLDPSLIMNSTCTLKAQINLISGDILYTIRIKKEGRGPELNSVIYSFSGNSSSEIPITATDYSNRVQSFVNSIVTGAAGIAGFAAGHPAVGVAGMASSVSSLGKSIFQSPNTNTNGVTGGPLGRFAVQYPYLIITRPKKVEANEYGSINGYPSMASRMIGNMKGYIKVHKCNWSIPGATSEELEEIDNLMKTEGALL